MYAEAAVDGSTATFWAPDPALTSASLTVDLGQSTTITRIAPQWTGVLPTSYQFLVSTDGTTWKAAPKADASGNLARAVTVRYVRVDLTRDPTAGRTGLAELAVIRSG